MQLILLKAEVVHIINLAKRDYCMCHYFWSNRLGDGLFLSATCCRLAYILALVPAITHFPREKGYVMPER